MTQERYFDWMAPVGSKKASEPFALVTGIGLKHGLNKVTVVARQDNGKYLLSLTNDYSHGRDQYISDKSNILATTQGSIITPDGILTNLTSAVELSEVDIPLANEFTDSVGTYFEVAIVASHLYVEDSSLLVNTIFRALPNRSSTSILTTVYPSKLDGSETKTMDDWYTHPNFSGLNKATEIIIGLAKIYQDNESHQMVNIYNNQWPTKVGIPDYQWSYVNNLLAGIQNHVVPKRSVQEWYGFRFADIPDGWVFCGSFIYGFGDDEAIRVRTGPGSSDFETADYGDLMVLLDAFNRKYSLYGSGAVTVRKVTSPVPNYGSDYAYMLDFGNRNINGVLVPTISGRFTMVPGIIGDGSTNYIETSQTGGASLVKLNANQSGVAPHSHVISETQRDDGSSDSGHKIRVSEGSGNSKTGITDLAIGEPALFAHENKPPFIAIPKIIKVI